MTVAHNAGRCMGVKASKTRNARLERSLQVAGMPRGKRRGDGVWICILADSAISPPCRPREHASQFSLPSPFASSRLVLPRTGKETIIVPRRSYPRYLRCVKKKRGGGGEKITRDSSSRIVYDAQSSAPRVETIIPREWRPRFLSSLQSFSIEYF